MNYLDKLIDAVTAKTKGTKGDPLTREEVAPIVEATLAELADNQTRSEIFAEPQALEDGGDIEPPAE